MSSILSKLINLAGNITGVLGVSNGGTGVTSSTGSGSVVLSTSPTLVTPALGTPASGTLTNCTGYPVVVPGTSNGLVSSSGVPGNTTGSAIASGFVGETPNAVTRAGTGGNAYSVRSTTAFAGSTTVISESLNIGIYLVSVVSTYLLTVSSNVTCYLTIGGTQVTNSTSLSYSGATVSMIQSGAVPIVITANSTTVGFVLNSNGAGTSTSNNHEMFIVRIA